jgi:hypothetical protein
MHYILTYCCNSYTLADAFRPNPLWGKRLFTVDLDFDISDEELIKGATDTAPEGHWLQHLEAIGGDPHRRTVFIKAVPLSKMRA